MDINETPRQPREYVDALLACTSLVGQILDHMHRHRSPDPDVPPPLDVLACLLEETLTPQLAERQRELDLVAATLAETARTIESEIYLVPPANRAERRRRQRPSC